MSVKRSRQLGTCQLGMTLSARLVADLRVFAAGREETMRQVVEEALRRHMAYPPPDVRPAKFPAGERRGSVRAGRSARLKPGALPVRGTDC